MRCIYKYILPNMSFWHLAGRYENLNTTRNPNAPASRMLQARQPLPLLLTRAFHPLSAHKARARISMSFPNLCLLLSKCGLGDGRGGKASSVESVQSTTRILGIVCSLAWVIKCAGSTAGSLSERNCGSERIESNVWSRGESSMVEMGILANSKFLCNGCPIKLC